MAQIKAASVNRSTPPTFFCGRWIAARIVFGAHGRASPIALFFANVVTEQDSEPSSARSLEEFFVSMII
jgi:hypothetical protein